MVTAGSDSGPHDASALADPRRTLTSLGVVVYDWDLGSDEIAWGPNAADILALPIVAACARGRDFEAMVEPLDGPTRGDAMAAASGGSEAGTPFAVTYGLALGGGRRAVVDDTGRWFLGADGLPARAHGTMRLRRADAGETAASLSRGAFLAQVGRDIQDATASKRALTLFAISIGNLADLNEVLGFEAADRVIGAVLARLCGTMRVRDRFLRYSGNRFALALRHCGPAEAEVAANRMAQIVTAEPIGTAQGPVAIQLVIGAASAPDHAVEAATLLHRAEAALGLAKRRAGAPFLVYDPRLFRASARVGRRDALFESIEFLSARRVALACQPVVDAATRRPVFREALLRIEGEDGRIRQAGDVVPALERAGLVHMIDARMLELVADELQAEAAGVISLNLSPLTLERPDWLATLSARLGRSPGIAARLIVEVTETAAIRDPDTTRRCLDTMKALGVSIAIDDFGSGHTSFRHLRDFPVDMVKIDGAFVQNLTRSPDDRFFIRTLVDLARHLGVKTVAEWVEDEESALLLASWGVDYLQGDHCGRPELVAPAPSARSADPASLVA